MIRPGSPDSISTDIGATRWCRSDACALHCGKLIDYSQCPRTTVLAKAECSRWLSRRFGGERRKKEEKGRSRAAGELSGSKMLRTRSLESRVHLLDDAYRDPRDRSPTIEKTESGAPILPSIVSLFTRLTARRNFKSRAIRPQVWKVGRKIYTSRIEEFHDR